MVHVGNRHISASTYAVVDWRERGSADEIRKKVAFVLRRVTYAHARRRVSSGGGGGVQNKKQQQTNGEGEGEGEGVSEGGSE